MQENIDYILTVKNDASAEFKEKGSRFIGLVRHTADEKEAELFLKEIQKKYYDATHHCYAYKITDSLFRYADAGEPSGTAGVPIFNAINRHQVYETMVIVVRYYGGTKLGTGGLTRAYNKAADLALQQAEIYKKILWQPLSVEFDYHYTNIFLKLLEKYNGKPDNLQYEDKVHGSVIILPSNSNTFKEAITEASAGNIKITGPSND